MSLLLRSLLLVAAGLVFFFVAGIVAVWAPDKPLDLLVERWAPPPSQFLAIGGMQVHLRDEGPRDDPYPIVLLHGTSDSLHTWDGWAERLRQRRRVIRFDLPGFGLTGPHPLGDYRIEAYVRFVADLLDRLGLQSVVLGGNSLGGQIAWSAAVRMPTRVHQLILVDAAGFVLEPQQVPLAFAVARWRWAGRLAEYLLPRGLVLASLRSVYGDPAKVGPALVDRYYDMALRQGNRGALARRLAAIGQEPDPQGLQSLHMPTLLLWGARDSLIPLRFGRQFAQAIAGSRLVVFEGLGHLPQQEDPARSGSEVERFLGLTPPD